MTLFLDRLSVPLDLRFSKTFNLGPRGRFYRNVDLYNALNANTQLGANENYGASWTAPALHNQSGGVTPFCPAVWFSSVAALHSEHLDAVGVADRSGWRVVVSSPYEEVRRLLAKSVGNKSLWRVLTLSFGNG